MCVCVMIKSLPRWVPYLYYKRLLLQPNSSVCFLLPAVTSLTPSLARPLPLASPLFPFVVSIPLVSRRPGGWPTYPWRRIPAEPSRGRARASPESRRLASPRAARAAFPRCRLPTGIPGRDNGAAYQGKQHPPRCQPATKTQTEGEKGKKKCKYSTTLAGGGEKQKRGGKKGDSSRNAQSQVRRIPLSALDARNQWQHNHAHNM